MEKGLQWETTWLDLPAGEHKKPEYLAVNPLGKVPALIDDGVIVHDSTVINEYLEDRYPKNPLLPRDPVMRARARAFEDYADSQLAPSLFKIFFQLRRKAPERDSAKIREGEQEALKHFAWLNHELEGRQFFAGLLSLGDISFLPHLSSYERAGYSIPDGLGNLRGWWERMKARASYAESWPGD